MRTGTCVCGPSGTRLACSGPWWRWYRPVPRYTPPPDDVVELAADWAQALRRCLLARLAIPPRRLTAPRAGGSAAGRDGLQPGADWSSWQSGTPFFWRRVPVSMPSSHYREPLMSPACAPLTASSSGQRTSSSYRDRRSRLVDPVRAFDGRSQPSGSDNLIRCLKLPLPMLRETSPISSTPSSTMESDTSW